MSEYFLRFDPQEIKAESTIEFLDSFVENRLLNKEEFEALTAYLDGEWDYNEYLQIFEDYKNEKGLGKYEFI